MLQSAEKHVHNMSVKIHKESSPQNPECKQSPVESVPLSGARKNKIFPAPLRFVLLGRVCGHQVKRIVFVGYLQGPLGGSQ